MANLTGILTGIGETGSQIATGLMVGRERKRREQYQTEAAQRARVGQPLGQPVMGADGKYRQIFFDPQSGQLSATEVPGMPSGAKVVKESKVVVDSRTDTTYVMQVYEDGSYDTKPLFKGTDPSTYMTEADKLLGKISNKGAQEAARAQVSALASQGRHKDAFQASYDALNEDRKSQEIFGRQRKPTDAIMNLAQAVSIMRDPNADPAMQEAARLIYEKARVSATPSIQWRLWTDDEGNQHITPLPSKPGLGAPPSVAPPSGGAPAKPGKVKASTPLPTGAAKLRGDIVLGPKGLSPAQQAAAASQLATIDATVNIIERMMPNLGILDSAIDAGKIAIATDPGTGELLLSRLASLTPDEQKFAGDFASLMEHINVLRAPLGATGFRSRESFEALQAQRGRLLANPGVTRQTLGNTLTILRQLQSLKRKMAGSYAQSVEGTSAAKDPVDSLIDKILSK